MRFNFSILLPFLLFYVFKGSSAQTPRHVITYTTKSVETLQCSFTSTIVLWTEQQDDGNTINLFSYDVTGGLVQKQANDNKYDNFDYSIEGTNGFNLVINNVDKGDGGRYQCNPITSPVIVTFNVTVEVLPESLSIHCTEINVCMPSAEKKADPKINCVCMATGLSSSVLEIEWEGVETFTASPTSIMNSMSGSFSIRSNITLPPPNGTASVSCSLSGYRSEIPKSLRRYTYTFSPPVCNLMHGCPSDGTNASLICSCSKDSPKVNAHSFYDSQKSPIGTQRSNSKSVQVETNKVEMFYCSGCNGVLHNRIEGHEFNCKQGQGSAWWIFIIIVGIMLLLVVAAIIVLVVKKPWPLKRKVPVEPDPTPEVEGIKIRLLSENNPVQEQKDQNPRVELYENTSGREHQKLLDASGIKPDISTSGDPATKDKDKGIKPEVSTSGDPVTKDKDNGMNTIPSIGGPAPKKDDKGEAGLNKEAQTKLTGSKGASNMTTSEQETSKDDDDPAWLETLKSVWGYIEVKFRRPSF